MRYFLSLFIMVWSCWAYAQPTFFTAFEKEYKQQLVAQLLEQRTNEPRQDVAIPCLSCPEEGVFPELLNELSPLRWTEIDLRDSVVCRNYNLYTEEWSPISKYVYSYNEAHQQAEYIYFTWDNGWDIYSHNLSSYNDSGLLSESIYQIWDMGWVNYSYTLYTYNDTGQLTERLFKVWDEGLGVWLDLFADHYSYDAQGRVIEEIFQADRTYSSGILSNQDKNVYTYADGDDPTSITRYRYYLSSEEWRLRERSLLTYFSPGTLQEELVEQWTGSDWRNTSRTLYGIDENGFRAEQIYQELYGADNWTNIDRYLYENDEEGNILERIFQKWVASTEEWQNDNQYIYSYDERTRLTNQYNREWRAIAYDWYSEYNATIQYDDNGNDTEILNQSWDEDSSLLLNSYRTLKTYDDQNYLLSLTYQIWEEDSWLNTGRILYEYDESGRVIRLQRLYWTEESGDSILYEEILTQYQDGLPSIEVTIEFWVNGDTMKINRSLHTYDDRDSLLEILTQYTFSGSSEWWNSQRTTIDYNPMGLRSEQLDQQWEGNEWIYVSRLIYTYDAMGQRIEQLKQNWQSEEQEWLNDWMDTWAFNDEGLVIEHTEMSWMADSQRWEGVRRELFSYDEAGRETLYSVLSWSDYLGRWQYQYRIHNIYDNATGLLLLNMIEYYDGWLTEKWELRERWIYEYNDQGQVTYFHAYRASPTQAGWSDLSHCQIYWRTVTPATEASEAEIKCLCANPYTAGSPITFEGLDANRRYELRLTGQWGRILYRKVLNGGSTFSLHPSLLPGFYILSLHDAEGLSYRQKLIVISMK